MRGYFQLENKGARCVNTIELNDGENISMLLGLVDCLFRDIPKSVPIIINWLNHVSLGTDINHIGRSKHHK
ncbi:Cell wall protein SED1 [Fusarium oxysporum f. sp. albedinis]|nr:Cell wall protein SED1 [Fusarium oxysporum f. sp. albedinis]